MEEESKGREGRRRRRKTSRLTERLNVISLLFHFGSLVHKLHSEFEIERETWSRSRNGDGAVAAAASVSLSPGPGLEQEEKEERERLELLAPAQTLVLQANSASPAGMGWNGIGGECRR